MSDAAPFLSIRELGERLRAHRVTSVTLAELAIDRLERLGPRTNAVAHVLRERALAEARDADRELRAGKPRGPLHGIPYGVKDLLAARGGPTTWGAEPYRNQVFDFDATVVERLHAAGAVLVAKLSMVELAGGMGYDHADAAFNGPGLTPWNTSFWSGGSSSGPGAAVASGLVPFAIGSETSGSILTPSAFCGVTGLRPTYGLVSRHGAMQLAYTLDKLGPMARSADDAALVLAAIAGHDPKDDGSADRGFDDAEAERPSGRLRVAVPAGCIEKVQPEVRHNFEQALAALDSDCAITRDVPWPDQPWGPAVGTIVAAEGATAFRELIESGRVKELRCPSDRTGGYSRLLVPAVDYLQAMRARKPMKRAMAGLFARFDVIAAPTRATVAYPADKSFNDVYPGISGGPPLIAAGNLCGLPALAVPTGFGEHGLPTSMQLMGPAFGEATLVALANAYQAKTDWHTRRPPVA